MHVTGQCHCGALAYEAEIDPEGVTICHCTDCQTMSSSAYRTSVRVEEADFRMLAGEPTLYRKTGDSGRERVQGFCAVCGTQIYSLGDGVYSVRVGAMRERAKLPAKRQIWCRSALEWTQDLTDLPRNEREGE
ncbi:GFA family protein [Pararhizobium mangrovi]|uniref:GFA family protein n=1 Tax=Pararhizobium mangrovi TaxID=2590452 RepID=A0A506TX49_9HYPH|nr:GFA family protein [Pararhizobium mangrovi]TPW26090.1 GFA family protein [Pararhizobium mangrovi]